MPALILLGIAAVTGCTRKQPAEDRVDAHCDLVALEARKPEFESTPLTDEALLALGGEAVADILEHCHGLSSWWQVMLRSEAQSWSPRLDDRRSLPLLPETPQEVHSLYARACGPGYARAREAPYLRGRERGHWTFASCEFERLGILTRTDTEYVEPGVVYYWAFHQMLLDSRLSEDAARRYFLALLLAAEIEEHAGGVERLRDGVLTYEDQFGTPVSVRVDNLEEPRGCRLHRLSVAPDEPMRNVIELVSSACAKDSDTLVLAIDERQELLRPLRAELDLVELDLSGDTGRSGLEIEIAASGTWKANNASGRPAELAALLDRQQPQWVVLRVDPATPARLAVDLARVVDVWRARTGTDTILLMKGK